MCSLDPKPLVWVCPGLFLCTQQDRAPSRLIGGISRAQILGLQETRRVFLWLSHKGGSAGLFPGKLHGISAPYSPSQTPPECEYVAVPSAGVKKQDGRKERRKEKDIQNKTKQN